MGWTKTTKNIRDVFSGKNFGEPGGLSGFFKNEYRDEYANQNRLGTNITDRYVAEFLMKHGM